MNVSFPLDEMTVEEKLQVMKDLWEDLSRNANDVPPPAWHGEELARREAALDAGEDRYEDWETVKNELRKLTS